MPMTQADSTTGAQGDSNPSPPARKRAWQGFSGLASTPRHLIIGAVLFVLSLCFNLYRLGTPSIWFDEAFSVELARHPVLQIWQIIFGPEPNMELYYLFLHYWLALTGYLGLNPTEFIVRFPSAIFAALSTVAVFSLGRRYLGLLVGTIGSLLYLLNFLQLYYDLQTRAYGMQLFLICVSWYALLTALSHRTSPLEGARDKQLGSSTVFWWGIYVLSTVLAVYAHLFSILIICAQFCAVVGLLLFSRAGGPEGDFDEGEAHKGQRSTRRGMKPDYEGRMGAWPPQVRKQIIPFGISLVATGVLSIPMLLVSMQGAKTGWLPLPHLHDLINFLYNMGGYNKPYLFTLLGCCVLGVLIPLLAGVPALGRFFQSGRLMGENGPMIWMLLCWFLVPVVVSYVVSQGATRLFSARYLVV